MKIKRQKLYKKTIQFYKSNYSYKEPFSVLMDPGFIKKCLNMNIFFKEALPKLLESKVNFYITPCCIAEMNRNPKEYSNDLIATCKRIEYVQCNHKHSTDEQNMVQTCFTDLSVKQPNQFFFAVQDHDHRLILRKNPGIPILFVLTNLIILEKPATSSYQTMIKTHKAITQINPREKEMLKKLKEQEKEKEKAKQPKKKSNDSNLLKLVVPKPITTPTTATTPTTPTTPTTTTTPQAKKAKTVSTISPSTAALESEIKSVEQAEIKKVEKKVEQPKQVKVKVVEKEETVTVTAPVAQEAEVKPNLKRKLDDADSGDNEKEDNKEDKKEDKKENDIKTTTPLTKEEKAKIAEENKIKRELLGEQLEKNRSKWVQERKKLKEKKIKKKELARIEIEKKKARIASGDTHKRTRRKRSQSRKNLNPSKTYTPPTTTESTTQQ